jgi:hypothetical protein
MSIGKPQGLAQSLHSCLSTPLLSPCQTRPRMSRLASTRWISLAEAASFRAAEPLRAGRRSEYSRKPPLIAETG